MQSNEKDLVFANISLTEESETNPPVEFKHKLPWMNMNYSELQLYDIPETVFFLTWISVNWPWIIVNCVCRDPSGVRSLCRDTACRVRKRRWYIQTWITMNEHELSWIAAVRYTWNGVFFTWISMNWPWIIVNGGPMIRGDHHAPEELSINSNSLRGNPSRYPVGVFY